MTSPYTAFHLYANRQYQEANRARREPYTLGAYRCAHSQRAFLGGYQDYSQRIHDDAAGVGGCCDEPVRLFEQRPQFIERSDATRSKECSKKVVGEICRDVQIGQLSHTTLCGAGSARTLEKVKVACYEVCEDDLLQLPGLAEWPGTHGKWNFLDLETKDELVTDFEIYQSEMDSVFNNCTGPKSITEYFCGDQSLSFTIEGDLSDAGGCYCDCCGDNGLFTAPNGVITPPGVKTATDANTLTLDEVVNSPACKNGSLSGNFQSTPHGYAGANSYGSYSGAGASVRKIADSAPVIGSAAYPACCGGTVHWSGDNGCSTGTDPTGKTTTINKGPSGSPALSIVDGIVHGDGSLEVGDTYDFQVAEACPNSSHAEIEYTETCMPQVDSGYYSNGFNLIRRTAPLALTSTSACKRCCGAGELQVDWNDGCDNTGSTTYEVEHPRSTGSTQRGAAIRCVPDSGQYIAKWATASCDGTIGTTWTQMGSYYATMALCIGSIDSSADTAIANLCNSGLIVSDCANCCHYTNNGLDTYVPPGGSAGDDFRAAIYCVDNTGWASAVICCDELYDHDPGWRTILSATCCPIGGAP